MSNRKDKIKSVLFIILLWLIAISFIFLSVIRIKILFE